ncbi:peptidase M24, structural domain-containing protein [Syncephalastrum racemosum]|uniref:Peptidase M24, structural domain-containing protein n=1 Tax=Syncephalastrum racemosum TaxID=13706 RepID=A0A1X2H3T2_SYNRA|nr:peptidase M24, structural domain-containing protein [Syncephalastrum racemosum]
MAPHSTTLIPSAKWNTTYDSSARLPTKEHCVKVRNLLFAEEEKASPSDGDHSGCPSDLSAQHERAILYLHGAKDMTRDDTDVELDFRQESHFFYLTGVNEPGFHVIVDFTAMQVYLVAPTISETDVMWKGAAANTSELLQQYDVDYIITEDDMGPTLKQLAPTVIHVLDTTDTTALPADMLPLLKQDDLRLALTRARLTKFPWEITALRRAADATSHCHTALMARFPSLFSQGKITEGRVAALFTGLAAACHGLDRQAYVPIVASGVRAAILHNTRRSGLIEPGALVLVDAGVEAGCYSSDVTRTFPASGTFSAEARTMYAIVLKMQKAVLAKLKAGTWWPDMELLAMQVLCEELVALGILCGSVDELLDRGVPNAFFYHGLGHSVGLDVHDVGGSYLFTEPLQPDMVITVEPGVYFHGAVLQAWSESVHRDYFDWVQLDRYRSVGGIRIEDTVQITADGHDNLTTAPKEIADIECLMQTSEKHVDLFSVSFPTSPASTTTGASPSPSSASSVPSSSSAFIPLLSTRA